jgi:hypothetical protein
MQRRTFLKSSLATLVGAPALFSLLRTAEASQALRRTPILTTRQSGPARWVLSLKPGDGDTGTL